MTLRHIYTIWNVTPSKVQRPVGSYTGWADVEGSIVEAEKIANGYLVKLRWDYPGDLFELRCEARPTEVTFGTSADGERTWVSSMLIVPHTVDRAPGA